MPPAGKHLEERIKLRLRREAGLIERSLADRRRVHRGVHEARKAIRRLRALLALVQERLEAVAVADMELRRLGDSLSRLRDAQVALESAQALVRRAPADAHPAVRWLKLRRDALIERALRRDPDFLRRRSLLRACRRALHAIAWDQIREEDLDAALHESRRRAAKAERKALKDPSADHLHRWRRRLRRLRMQLEILRGIAPAVVQHLDDDGTHGKSVRLLRKQSDRLGREQDLDNLAAVLRRMPMSFERELLLREIERKQRKKAG